MRFIHTGPLKVFTKRQMERCKCCGHPRHQHKHKPLGCIHFDGLLEEHCMCSSFRLKDDLLEVRNALVAYVRANTVRRKKLLPTLRKAIRTLDAYRRLTIQHTL